MLNLVTSNSEESQAFSQSLDEIARLGAQRMLSEALKREVSEYVEKHQHLKDENGHSLVVRNGKAKARKVTIGSGTVEVEAPRVHDKREGKSFTSNILPPYLRKSKCRVTAARSLPQGTLHK